MIRQILILLVFLSVLGVGEGRAALLPEEILLIVNQNVPEGLALATYYQQVRHIPSDNVLVVNLPGREECSRREYEKRLADPLRQLLAETRYSKIRCLLLFYGMPLRIQSAPRPKDQHWDHRQRINKETGAAVDSELVLVRAGSYQVAGLQPNPYFAPGREGRGANSGLLVSRLDAQEPETVKRMIDDSIAAEKNGLHGKAYFDARWPFSEEPQNAYQRYDRGLHQTARLTQQITTLPVVLDDAESLFNRAGQAAIYCGWYHLGEYLDVFSWQPGAIAYHIASGECTSLKNPDNHGWCKGILEAGGAATLGPVAEPYLNAFPRPDLFFEYLYNGYYTLVESYFFSLPYVSWQMILLGDPLYRPFRNQ